MMDKILQQKITNLLSKGLPISEYPYAVLADKLGVDEESLLNFIRQSVDEGVFRRIGMVVNHHKIGYQANAMVVWDVPDEEVDRIGELLGRQEKITLSYRRPRVLPDWPYNLFTMVHGKHRPQVLAEIQAIIQKNNLQNYARDILFSYKKFKQTGARFYDQ